MTELNPNTEPTTDVELDPHFQSHQDTQNEKLNRWEDTEQEEDIENAEAKAQAEKEEREDERNIVHKAVHGVVETAAQPVLGVGDFASDVVGIVPWLKPIDDWWDKNSPRASHPGHKMLRDASSIIIPTLYGGTLITGGAKAAVAARSITLPKYAHTLGSIAAWTGVDTGVAMISSHSKTDDNMAAT